jgi:uncharacterized protein YwgA
LSDKEKLVAFLKTLDNAGIISFDKNRFSHRIRLQKYVYIARKFGFSTSYSYSLYIHGPYSSDLADDYYRIDNFENKEPTRLDPTYVRLVRDRNEEWLELAATIIMIKERHENISDDKLIDLVKTVKPFSDKDELSTIISCLEDCDCLN